MLMEFNHCDTATAAAVEVVPLMNGNGIQILVNGTNGVTVFECLSTYKMAIGMY